MMLENGGVYVCRTRHLQLAGSTRTSTPAMGNFPPMSPRISSPMHNAGGMGASPGGGGGGGGRGRGRGMGRRDTDLIGQTIKIIKGPFKGTVLRSPSDLEIIFF